ncbi:MAG: class I SAM-dependent methyltransferase [Lentisphaerae bacterium]|nr:class I SAM-dependent methyltransferase [Lentisphaerota bacterium]
MSFSPDTLAAERRNVHTPDLLDEAYAGRPPAAYRELLALVVRMAPPGRIADVGCGLGLFLECARAWGLDAVGCDASAHAVETCRRKGLAVDLGVLSDGLPWAPASCTAVLMNQVIEHLPGEIMPFVLREAHRTLSPGGVLIVTSPCRHIRAARQEATHINLLVPAELREAIRGAGFELLQDINDMRDFGCGRAGRLAARLLYRLGGCPVLSRSANALARKPLAGSAQPPVA